MDLTFTNKNGKEEILSTSNDLKQLKEKASNHYTGEDLLIWISSPAGKPYIDHAPDVPCSCSLEDGSSYSIS